MKLHEKHCTANPNRECRVCKKAVPPLSFKAWMAGAELNGLKEIRLFCAGCPACMLAVIRQNQIIEEFDYKAEMTVIWQRRDEQARREDEYQAIHG